MMDVIALTVDVEWASPEVLADLVRLFDERSLRATFFCTHPGIDVEGHERALHPNFRRNGDTLRQLRHRLNGEYDRLEDTEIYRHVVRATHAFCPEAIGVRGHSLFYDSQLLPIYHESGLQYDSTYAMPLTAGLEPVWKEYDLLELPIYYNDHFDLKAHATDFRLERLALERPGLKVFNFHPNMVFLNASSNEQYLESKPHYHNYEQLLARRSSGPGIRTLLLDLLDRLAGKNDKTRTLAEVNQLWRTTHRPNGL